MDLQEYIGSKLKYFRLQHKMTQQDLADKLKTTKQTISRYEKGQRKADQDVLFELSSLFNVSINDFFPDDNSQIEEPPIQIQSIVTTSTQLEEKRQENVLTYAKQQLAEQRQEQAKKSNVIEFNMADEINEELYPYNVTEKSAAAKSLSRGYSYNPDFNETFTVYSDYKTSKHYDIATQVVGDSMEPKYPDGDIVLIQKGYDNWNGGVYVVDYDGMTYLKKVFLEENQFRLVSINPKYDDIIIDVPVDEDIYFNIVGRVVDSFTPVER